MSKSIWLSEEQICDIFEKDPSYFFEELHYTNKWYREFKIGRGRIDFANIATKKGQQTNIDLFEFKITASIDSVIQLIKYSRNLNEYIRQMTVKDIIEYPNVSLNLVARYFDAKIIEICCEFDIALWRIDVISNSEISIELEEMEYFPNVPDCSFIKNILKELS